MSDITELLVEIRELRKEVNTGFSDLGERVTRVETRIAPLFDNGQPGRLTKMEDDIQGLKEDRWKAAGFLVAVGILWNFCSHWIALKLGIG